MLEQPICKICGHEFFFHRASEQGMSWWCVYGVAGEICPCDNFYPENSRSEQFDKFHLN
jgi:hypothetical protein